MAPKREKTDNDHEAPNGRITPLPNHRADLLEPVLNPRYQLIRLALSAITRSGLDRLLAPSCRGAGVILTFHHVRPEPFSIFPENAGLSITPEFLDRAIRLLGALGYDIIPLGEVAARLESLGARPFAVLTFDDGYIDNLDHALPVLKAHRVPFMLFACPGFAERTAPLWWLDLEEAVLRLNTIRLEMPGGAVEAPARTMAEKYAAFRVLYWRLRGLDEAALRAGVAALCRQAGIDQLARVARLCMDWEQLRAFAAEPLATIGAHSLSHPRLARLDVESAAAEIDGSVTRIAEMLGRVPQHFAYPVGDRLSAGQREFGLAGGFASAVTTVPGVLRPAHSGRMAALPRISVNGLFQREEYLSALLSGVPFAFSR